MMSQTTQAGFTLIEAVITVAIAVPILMGIALTTTSVNDAIEANSRSADVSEYGRDVLRDIVSLTRGAQVSSLRSPAVPNDVAAGRAATLNDWIQPTDSVWRPGIEFSVLEGLQALNGEQTTSQRRIVFQRDANELPNGKDDDGDGLVDEGRIIMLRDGVSVHRIRDVERFEFALEDRLLRVRLMVARRSMNGRQHRVTTERELFLHNN